MATNRSSEEEEIAARNDENEMEVDDQNEGAAEEEEEMMDEASPVTEQDEEDLIDGKRIRPPRPKRSKNSTTPSTGQSDEEEDEDEEEEEPIIAEKSRISEPEHAPLSNADGLINVGTEYQAVIDSAEKQKLRREKEVDRDVPIWKTPEDMDPLDLKKYVDEAAGRFRIPVDRALFILQKEGFDVKNAIKQVAGRRELRDNWTAEESSLFANCYFHYGKKFKRIQVAMPHRSLSSIIQFYYDTKKKTSYKMTIDAQICDNDDTDALTEEMRKLDKKPAGLCENCHAKSDLLLLNKAMSRFECRACLLYFRMMRVPRPSKTLSFTERQERVHCPEYMKKYMRDYVELTKPADGRSAERLGFKKREKAETDDECMVINEDPLTRPSPIYIKRTGENEDPADENTCRMTRLLDEESSEKSLENMRKPGSLSIPLIWRKNATRAMEDYETLNEESRRRMTKATASIIRVKMSEVAQWKKDIHLLRGRWNRRKDVAEEDPKGSRSGKVRHDYNWTSEEKKDVVRCFHWYKDDFETIADVMGTKTQDQIRVFYKNNESVISKSIDMYRKAVTGKLNSITAAS